MSFAHIYVIPDETVYKGGDLFDKYGNLEYFADVAGLTDKTSAGYDKVISVKSHSRNHFMRDPAPVTISASTRYVYMGVRQTKGAVPGYTITLTDEAETRDFQYTGTISALYAWLKANAKVQIDMFGPTATPYDQIPVATSQFGAAGEDKLRLA